MEKISINELVSMTALRRLVKMYNETEESMKFIKKVIYDYEPKIDKLMEKQMEKEAAKMFKKVDDPNRPLFSEETARKIMSHMNEESVSKVKE